LISHLFAPYKVKTESLEVLKKIEKDKEYLVNRVTPSLFNKVDKIIFGLYNVMQKENILIFQKARGNCG